MTRFDLLQYGTLQDLHTHTTYCDGKNTPREMIEAAIAKGLRRIGFSGHSPSPCPDEDYAMAKEEVPAYVAEIRGTKFVLSDFQQRALAQNNQQPTAIVAGIRPQHITVGEGDLTATIEVSEMMGSEYNIHARSNADEVVMVIPTVGTTTDLSIGSTVNFTTKPDLIQLFDKASGNNLIWYDADSVARHEPVCKSYDFE
jgi:hypothetical protein